MVQGRRRERGAAVTRAPRPGALAAAVVLCAVLATACGSGHGTGEGHERADIPAAGGASGSPAVTDVPTPSATGLAELARIVNDAESAVAAAESDAAGGE